MSTIDVQGQYLVQAGESLSFTDEPAFAFVARPSGKPSELVIKGDVSSHFTDGASDDNTTVLGAADQGPARLDIREGGMLSASADTGDGGGGTSAFALAADGSLVVNHGQVHSQADLAAAIGWVSGAGTRVVNAGEMTVSADTARGLILGGTAAAVNSGSIQVNGGQFAMGFMLLGDNSLHNSGDIIVQALTGAYGVSSASGAGEIRNSGSIVAIHTDAGGDSIGIAYGPGDQSLRLVNSGLISADRAIFAPDPIDKTLRILNSGEIDGTVQLAGGADVLRNTGTILGDIDLGRGDDLYDGSHGAHTGAIYGADSDDRLFGGAGNDNLWGDRAELTGWDGDDLLRGGHGEDSLHGGAGADTLVGGADADQLHGGAGADVFAYAKASDSVAGHADFITDLEASDRIDLSAIDADATQAGDQAFTLVSALDGHAGQAALSYDAGSNLTTLSLDTDGDGAADTLIHLAGDQTGFTGLVL